MKIAAINMTLVVRARKRHEIAVVSMKTLEARGGPHVPFGVRRPRVHEETETIDDSRMRALLIIDGDDEVDPMPRRLAKARTKTLFRESKIRNGRQRIYIRSNIDPLWSHAMPNLSIKNVPEQVVAKLRQRAAAHRRSLQGELLELVCRSTEDDTQQTTTSVNDGHSTGWLSIDEIVAEVTSSERSAAANLPLAVDLIRRDRDAR